MMMLNASVESHLLSSRKSSESSSKPTSGSYSDRAVRKSMLNEEFFTMENQREQQVSIAELARSGVSACLPRSLQIAAGEDAKLAGAVPTPRTAIPTPSSGGF